MNFVAPLIKSFREFQKRGNEMFKCTSVFGESVTVDPASVKLINISQQKGIAGLAAKVKSVQLVLVGGAQTWLLLRDKDAVALDVAISKAQNPTMAPE
jgi:hypothetical protein